MLVTCYNWNRVIKKEKLADKVTTWDSLWRTEKRIVVGRYGHTGIDLKSSASSFRWLDADINCGLGSFIFVRLQHRNHSAGVTGFMEVHKTSICVSVPTCTYHALTRFQVLSGNRTCLILQFHITQVTFVTLLIVHFLKSLQPMFYAQCCA
jgi:hypothetical protein